MSLEAEEKLKLTPEQKKAFNRFKRAFNDCRKLGVQFEMSMETIIGLNGNNISNVEERETDEDNPNEVSLSDADTFDNSFNTQISPWVDCDVCITVE